MSIDTTKCFNHRLYLVIAAENCPDGDFCKVAKAAIKGGVDLVQLREKGVNDALFLQRAISLKNILDEYHIPLIINDNLWVAQQVQAAGIHVGNSDISPVEIRKQWPETKLLGYSIEALEQVNSEKAIVSDCLGISPVFSTNTKKNTKVAWGLSGIETIRKMTQKPLIAIGNMQESNAFDVIKAGADCIAVVSAICSAQDPEKAAYLIRNQIEKAL